MNSSVYVFGSLGDGYTQYPDDYAKDIYMNFYRQASADSQMIIHRDNSLMYYGYIRKLDENSRYIGFCILLNGVMYSQIGALFPIFENAVADLVSSGRIVGFNDKGNIVARVDSLSNEQQEVERIVSVICNAIAVFDNNVKKLPPVSYGIANDVIKNFTVSDKNDDIVDAAIKYGYTCIFKDKGYNTVQINSYKGVLSRVSKERDGYAQQLTEKKKEIQKLKAQQRNMTWVGILGFIVLIFGAILWNKVLFPSEVTHYETGEFVYYGPMKNNKPHGVGVAIYPENDKDGRKYYIGNFVNGERQDTAAMLFYKHGDFYYGSMKGDEWDEGLLYVNSNNSHFKGKFQKNYPYDGIWFDHKIYHRLVEGTKR